MSISKNLKELSELTFADYSLYLGYCAWALIPSGILFFLNTYASETIAFWGSSLVQASSVILMSWASVCIILVASLRLKNITAEHINIQNISTYAWKIIPALIILRLGIGIASTAGTIAFIIPGILAYTYTLFAQFSLIYEGASLPNALKTSYQLTKAHPFRLFFTYVGGNIVIGSGMFLLLGGSVFAITQVLGIHLADLTTHTPPIIALLETVITLPFMPLFILYPLILYRQALKTL